MPTPFFAAPVRLLVTAIVALLLVATWSPSASEAGLKVRSCGHYGYIDYLEETGWTSDIREISGAGIFNVVSRGVPCSDARRITMRAYPGNSYRGWKCRYLAQGYEYAKVRCGRPSGRMVRWETAA